MADVPLPPERPTELALGTGAPTGSGSSASSSDNGFIIDNNRPTSIYEAFALIRRDMQRLDWNFYNKVAEASGDEKDFVDMFGSTVSQVLKGGRIPTNVVANNPAFQPVSVIAMRMFGASPIYKIAQELPIPKRIATFPTVTHGASMTGFDIMNNPIFQGLNDIQGVVGHILLGSSAGNILQSGSLLFNDMQQIVSDVAGLIGVPTNASVNLSDFDSVVQITKGIANRYAGTELAFSSDIFSDGLRTAIQVTQVLQNGLRDVNQLERLVAQGATLVNDTARLVNSFA